MYRIHLIILLICGTVSALPGCKKYLQVEPVGAYTEKQVFANKKAVEQALNGMYVNLASSELYGLALTQTYIELMAQQYRAFVTGITFFEQYQLYNYDGTHARQTFDKMWRTAYSTIMADNLFLEKLDASITTKVISNEAGSLLKGEALAIRALLHFDMLRVFGAAYSLGADKITIPYYVKADAQSQPFLTSAEVVEKLVADLTEAENLLQNDPVKVSGAAWSPEPEFYSTHRNQRMNYLAVKALKARVYLWAQKTTEAHQAALEAVTEIDEVFPWSSEEEVKSIDKPDRLFSSEVLFAVYNREMYNNYAQLYSTSQTEAQALIPLISNLRAVFENNENDYRFGNTWKAVPGKTYRAFYKYEGVSAPQRWGYLQPLIRKSELYYILAETEPDAATALDYLNEVRTHRGLAELPNTATVAEEISKEYRKEFYGEGQLFFYFKRTNTATIPDAMDGSPRTPVYVVPLPLSETTPR